MISTIVSPQSIASTTRVTSPPCAIGAKRGGLVLIPPRLNNKREHHSPSVSTNRRELHSSYLLSPPISPARTSNLRWAPTFYVPLCRRTRHQSSDHRVRSLVLPPRAEILESPHPRVEREPPALPIVHHEVATTALAPLLWNPHIDPIPGRGASPAPQVERRGAIVEGFIQKLRSPRTVALPAATPVQKVRLSCPLQPIKRVGLDFFLLERSVRCALPPRVGRVQRSGCVKMHVVKRLGQEVRACGANEDMRVRVLSSACGSRGEFVCGSHGIWSK